MPEVWLRGPVDGVPALLQPVAHALLQAREDVTALTDELPADRLWDRPGGAASAGFHLQHLAGVLDRMLTYARGEPLSDKQLATLAAEGARDEALTPAALADAFGDGVDAALAQLRATDPATLADARPVGRQRLPSTVVGTLVHAAEHTQRHVGQLLVTVRVVGGGRPGRPS
ncbi:DinB family protein [Rubrivirga sp.]|uniref:DinB family protein n=1 Tax=Rubrivirga sp. TaxID=1885344 RepID=UPI003B52C646